MLTPAKLPAYTKDSKNEVFGTFVAAVEAFKSNFKNLTTNIDRVSSLSESMTNLGFGSALLILSNNELDHDLRQRFEVGAVFDIDVQKLIAGTIVGIPKDKVREFLAKSTIPNWDKAGQATMPAWGDINSRKDLITILLTQLHSNVAAIIKLNKAVKAGKTPPKDVLIDCMYRSAASSFIIGLILGLHYAKPKDFDGIEFNDSHVSEATVGIPGFSKNFKTTNPVTITELVDKHLSGAADRVIADAITRGEGK